MVPAHFILHTVRQHRKSTRGSSKPRLQSMSSCMLLLPINFEYVLLQFSMLRGLSDNWGDWEYNEARELETMLSEVLKTFENTT